MTKRRLNKQQAQRITEKQQAYFTSESPLFQGLVITRFGRHVEIEDEQGKRIHCSIRQHLPHLVAGDSVLWTYAGHAQGVVVSLCPRISVLARKHGQGEEKPVAANITQLVIVIAPEPEIVWPLLDSYLIMASRLQLRALIILNKTDLPCDPLKNRWLTDYAPLGYPYIFTQKEPQLGYESLLKALNHQVSVFVGQSGVGKSSLIATILPHEKHIITADLSKTTSLGQHTTSHSRYYHLPLGGALIDSPGMREFTLSKMDPTQVAYHYPELKPLIIHCKFRNCNHRDTPGCAIIQALEKGEISALRYENFKKLYETNAK
jgi:ribosome biogenesis GTPase / thiamine phosphate phosphatase